MKAKKQKKTHIVPLGDRALIKLLPREEKTPGGIILPETAGGKKEDRGRVIAIGEGRIDENGKKIPMRVKVGDMVLFQWGDKVEIDSEEYHLVSENNILAVIK